MPNLRRAWDRHFAERFRTYMGFLRKHAREANKSDDPAQWKRSKPSWMDRKVWDEMCDRWSGHDYADIREKNRRNRRGSESSDATAPATYAGGSISTQQHQKRLVSY